MKTQVSIITFWSKLDTPTIIKIDELKYVSLSWYIQTSGQLLLASLKLNVNKITQNNPIIGSLLLVHLHPETVLQGIIPFYSAGYFFLFFSLALCFYLRRLLWVLGCQIKWAFYLSSVKKKKNMGKYPFCH